MSPSPAPLTAAGTSPRVPAAARGQAGNAQVWAALWTCYLVWGSTYLAIRVMVETIPALLGAGVRFILAGAIMLAVLGLRRGWRALRIDRAQLASASFVGFALMGANSVVTLAEKEVPSALAALLVAAIPLWAILVRLLARERPARVSIAAAAVGFVGVAILLQPGRQTGGASLLALLAIVAAALLWAVGSFASPRIALPRDPLVSTGWQMLVGGAVIVIAGLLAGEGPHVHPGAFSGDSLLAFAYLVTVGSLLAFSAYSWLLQHAPLSKVTTYAYVNPVVAIVLGALILHEAITPMTLLGAAIIVVSVALVIRTESRIARAARPAA